MNGVDISRHEEGTRGEYVAHIEGSGHKGLLTWKAAGKTGGANVRIADHTLVPPEVRNLGIAARLVETLAADAREQGFRIVPQCSYVAAAFARHPEWSEIGRAHV